MNSDERCAKKILAEMSETADKNTFAGALAQEFSHFVTLSNYIIWFSFCQQFFHGFSRFFTEQSGQVRFELPISLNP